MKKKVTFERTGNGQFDVLVDGVKSGYSILNGSLGLSGRTTNNVYGFTRPNGTTKWIGTLQSCKKLLTFTLSKEVK